MTKQRAEIPFSSSFDDLNPSDWKPAPPAPAPEAPPVKHEEIRKVAKASGFRSREAAAVEEKDNGKPGRTGRIYRTGRSEQLNLKVRGDDKKAFYEICDNNNWVQGYVFQRAVEALRRELEKAPPKA